MPPPPGLGSSRENLSSSHSNALTRPVLPPFLPRRVEMSTPPEEKEVTASVVHASPARTPEACSPNVPAVARPGAPAGDRRPHPPAPRPAPGRPPRERPPPPPPRGLQVGPASRSRSLRTSSSSSSRRSGGPNPRRPALTGASWYRSAAAQPPC